MWVEDAKKGIKLLLQFRPLSKKKILSERMNSPHSDVFISFLLCSFLFFGSWKSTKQRKNEGLLHIMADRRIRKPAQPADRATSSSSFLLVIKFQENTKSIIL